MCATCGLDPEAYLASVLDRLARGRHPNNRLEELPLWNFTPTLAIAA
jgi:transposase